MSHAATIAAALHKLAAQHNVTVLLSVEAGSRAWDLHTADSDFDVKFIYVHPLNWYLSIEADQGHRRDVIEEQLTTADGQLLDIHGWDLPKALRMLRESNCSIIEWLLSPTVYIAQPTSVLGELQALAARFVRVKPLMYHLISKTRKHYQLVRSAVERQGVASPKKYLYALQPLLAASRLPNLPVEANTLQERIPNLELPQLLEAAARPNAVLPGLTLSSEEHNIIASLITLKQQGALKNEPSNPILDNLIDRWLTALDSYARSLDPNRNSVPLGPFDAYFQKVVLSMGNIDFVSAKGDGQSPSD